MVTTNQSSPAAPVRSWDWKCMAWHGKSGSTSPQVNKRNPRLKRIPATLEARKRMGRRRRRRGRELRWLTRKGGGHDVNRTKVIARSRLAQWRSNRCWRTRGKRRSGSSCGSTPASPDAPGVLQSSSGGQKNEKEKRKPLFVPKSHQLLPVHSFRPLALALVLCLLPAPCCLARCLALPFLVLTPRSHHARSASTSLGEILRDSCASRPRNPTNTDPRTRRSADAFPGPNPPTGRRRFAMSDHRSSIAWFGRWATVRSSRDTVCYIELRRAEDHRRRRVDFGSGLVHRKGLSPPESSCGSQRHFHCFQRDLLQLVRDLFVPLIGPDAPPGRDEISHMSNSHTN